MLIMLGPPFFQKQMKNTQTNTQIYISYSGIMHDNGDDAHYRKMCSKI